METPTRTCPLCGADAQPSPLGLQPTPQPDAFPTVHDVLISLFTLIGALSHRLTGRLPSVKIHSQDGKFVWNFADINKVRWLDLQLKDIDVNLRDTMPELFARNCENESVPIDTTRDDTDAVINRLDKLDPDQIRNRLGDLERQRRTLMVLLRALQAQQRAARKKRGKDAPTQ